MIDFHTDILPLRDRVFRLALRITLDRHEAEDIAQETFVRVWERREQWSEIENIQAYCLSVCHRLAVDHVRQRQLHAQKEPEIAEHQRAALMTEEPDERIDVVHQLINQLPELQRTIMQLRDIEGLRYNEITDVTGLTETQVKVYLHRARTRIKEAICPKIGHPPTM